jgi:hypothetical protein
MSKFPKDEYDFDVHHNYENDGYKGFGQKVEHTPGNFMLMLAGILLFILFTSVNFAQPKGEQHNGTEQTNSAQGNKSRQ